MTTPLPAALPIALLPVRLETRWSVDTLRVRIIPDTLQVDAFEGSLTDDERRAGTWYWDETANGRATTAWDVLTDRFSAARAAWIAYGTRAGTAVTSRVDATLRAAVAAGLPTRWQVLARTGDEVVRGTGTPITPRPMPVGPDPTGASTGLPTWMTDFAVAVTCGMGVDLPLGPTMVATGRIDQLVVYGIDDTRDPTQGADLLAGLFDAHYFTDGFAYLAPGTATNNSVAADSPYAPGSVEYRRSYQVPAADPPAPGPRSAGGGLAAALGLPLTTVLGQAPPAIAVAEGATSTDELTAAAMNDALWAATWGYYLSQVAVAAEGEDSRRRDHRNVISDDAFLRSLDRERQWPTAQRRVITSVNGTDPGEPGSAAFNAAWSAAINRVTVDQHVDVPEATRRLGLQVDAALLELWRELTGRSGTQLDDWLAAAADLRRDRTARYAYFRWLNRTARGRADDSRVDDWLAGETAARFGPGTARAARAHFRDFVRPGGALPTFHVGRQPYGVLPVTSLDQWKPTAADDDLRAAVHAMRVLRDTVWRPAAAHLPRIGSGTPDVDTANRTLLDIMGAAPVSTDLFARITLGPDYLRNLWRFAAPGLRPDWEAVRAARSEDLLDDVGIAWLPRVTQFVAAEQAARVDAPLVTMTGRTTADWLGSLAAVDLSPADLQSQADPAGDDTPVLYRLLRHSLLREYADAAVDVLDVRGALGDWQHLDTELIGIRPGTPDATVWSGLASTGVGTPDGFMPLADYLQTGPAEDGAAGITAFRAAATTLAGIDDATLGRHLMQTLDATASRLDAWVTSLATRRLAEHRSLRAGGVLIGGYGWVTDLVRADPVSTDIGFVHAPSVAQAVTAAVLRSGYDAHSGGARNPFAVNLASDRVRLATALLDTVRAGAAPGPALGYLFERTLQATTAGQYVPAFRDLAPTPHVLAATDDDQASTTIDLATGVVDGLVLTGLYTTGSVALTTLLDRITADDAHRSAPLRPVIAAALDQLGRTVDATADALMAEAVHHAVNGAPGRAAATMDALARADGSVPELTAMRTAPTGTPVTHRLAITLAADHATAPHWPDISTTAAGPRTAASPRLEVLLQTLFPDPAEVRVDATVRPADGTAVSTAVTLADAGISAVDCVLSTPRAPDAAGDAPSPLLLAGLASAARTAVGASDSTPVDLDPGSADPTATTLRDVVLLSRTLADILARSRPLVAADLARDAPADDGTPSADLLQRAIAAGQALADITALVTGSNQQQQVAGLLDAARIGIAGAVPRAGEPPDAALVGSVAAELAARQKAFEALDADQPVARIQAALGADLPVLEPVTVAEPGDLLAAVSAATADFASPTTRRRWLAAAAAARAASAAVFRLTTLRTALRLDPTTPRTLQLPPVLDDHGASREPWIGGSFGGGVLGGPRSQLTYLDAGGTQFDAAVAGMLVDTWTETIPSRSATTGIAFRFPTPTSQPPQTVVLAVHPDPGADTWDEGTLEAVLLETIDLAHLRAVDLDALAGAQDSTGVGQLLPATHLAFNPRDPADTVSTELVPPLP